MTDETLSDQNLANATKAAAVQLNEMIERCIVAGLTVDLDIAHIHPAGAPKRENVVIKVRRDL